MKKTTIIIAVAFCLALALPAVAGDDGATTFGVKCAACHGKTGNGDTPMGKTKKLRDLGSPDVQKLTDEQLINQIANGGPKKTASHAYKTKGLTDDQIKALVTFIRSLKK